MYVIYFFQQDKHYNLRSDFPVPRYNTVKYGKHSIRYLGPHIWGKISQELRSKTSLQAFRRGLRALNVLHRAESLLFSGHLLPV